MNTFYRISILFFLATPLAFAAQLDSNHSPAGVVTLQPASMKLAGIKVKSLQLKSIKKYIVVPGEIVPNQQTSAIVAPRVQAQVIKRLVNVGDKVSKDQPLVVLSSVAVANAQSELLLFANHWQRLRKLKANIVTKKAYQEAKIKFQQAYAKLLAYGLTNSQIKAFIDSKIPHKANGTFTLLAPISGTISQANLIIGEMVAAGTKLYIINNEDTLWINALLSAESNITIPKDASATIETNHKKVMGRVVQVHHQLEHDTRTRSIIIQIPNGNDDFHAGEFVTCRIAIGQVTPGLSVPKSAVLTNAHGKSIVYVAFKPHEFRAQEVKTLAIQGNQAIIAGIVPGTKVVTHGAFFINAEKNKNGFDAHNH